MAETNALPLEEIVAEIRASEYRFSSRNEGQTLWSAPNRAKNLRTYISSEGVRFEARKDAGWFVELSLTEIGRDGEPAAVPTGRIEPDGARISIERPGISEWFVNNEAGLEQGFTLTTVPGGAERAERLRLGFDVRGLAPRLAGSSEKDLEFLSEDGRLALRYAGLVAFDADRKTLPAHFEIVENRMSIVVDDRAARYPIVIDPVATAPNWFVESDQAQAGFGVSVAGGGTVNNDIYDDVVIGAEKFDNGEIDEGRIFVYHGSGSGLNTAIAWTAESNVIGAQFGATVAMADVNGDGLQDVITGAPRYTNGETIEGGVFVYYGTASGLDDGGTRLEGTPQNADWIAEGEQDFANLGGSVANAGDVNDDTFEDIIVGATEYSNGQTREGAAFVYHGSLTGLDPDPMGPLTRNPGTPLNADWSTESNTVDPGYGSSVAGAGDVNNDGYDDVIVGAPDFDNNRLNEGRVYLYRGGAGGLETTAVWTLDGGEDVVSLGVSVAGAGNVNGDDFDDVIIGADQFTNGEPGEGRAIVFHGVASANLGTTPVWTAEANQGEADFGRAVASAGDVNADGFDDVIIGSPSFDNGELEEGAAFLYYGQASGLLTEAARSYESDVAGASFGGAVASAGDVNGDGWIDIVIGSEDYTKIEDEEGGAFAYHGCDDADLDGVCDTIDNCLGLVNPEQLDADTDGLGDACDPCTDVDLDTICDEARVFVQGSGPGETVLVEQGSVMRYLVNVTDPAIFPVLDWTTDIFEDITWPIGTYGVGFENEATGAQDLINTMTVDQALSIYTRVPFTIDDLNRVENVFLGVDYDDGYVAWINGIEVFRSPEMPAGDPNWNTAASPHESSNATEPNYGALNDITATAINAMMTGPNVLAIGVWNRDAFSSDLVVVPRLSINRATSSSIKYIANENNPGYAPTTAWVASLFDDSDWEDGNYGIGFENTTVPPNASQLINTSVSNIARSVYTRAKFNVSLDTVQSVFFGADYDDAYVVWINGNEVLRSPEMPAGEPTWFATTPAREPSNGLDPDYTPLIDISALGLISLIQGENTVAIGIWNNNGGSSDMVLVPRLSINDNFVDNCVGVPNLDQTDTDLDGEGDACDLDDDDDTVLDDFPDNCPLVPNVNQENADGDADGDACDVCINDATNDADDDGICANVGFLPPKTDDEDNCPVDFNPGQEDLNSDGEGDACDDDIDGDGVLNVSDNCPREINDLQENLDNDPNGDACDCTMNDLTSWQTPIAVDTLQIRHGDTCDAGTCTISGGGCTLNSDCTAPPATQLFWSVLPNDDLGGTVGTYDTVRSTLADNFGSAACVETNGSDGLSTESASPGVNAVYFYMVRVENNCPTLNSALGTDSEGGARTASGCP